MKNNKQIEYILPICLLLLLFFIFLMPISIQGSVIVFMMILFVNLYVFCISDWNVSRKMNSKRTFDKIQKSTLFFFLIEFIISLICVFYGLTGYIGVFAVGLITIVISAIGIIYAILLKVDYDCFN